MGIMYMLSALMYLILVTVGTAQASDRIFMKLDRYCFPDPYRNNALEFSPRGTDSYLEIVGSITPKTVNWCSKFLFVNSCKNLFVYDFQTVCRGGFLMTAPQFYMAYFADDPSLPRLEYLLQGNQLSITADPRTGQLSWSRLSEQIFRIDKWRLCRG